MNRVSKVASACLGKARQKRVESERYRILRKIYAPFAALKKDSPEYNQLGASGTVWEDYFEPGNSDRYGYVRLQETSTEILQEIDDLRKYINFGIGARRLIAKYAHQSVVIENNRLKLADSISIEKNLLSTTLDFKLAPDLPSSSQLRHLALPGPRDILPEYADASQVAELRNHIVASHWVTENAIADGNSPGLCEGQVRDLCALVNRDTNTEDIHENCWGKRVVLGDYRPVPIRVKSNPLHIFPYPAEVPALMRRFFQWRAHNPYNLHPILFACQAMAYFLHIHPFLDGNGRCSRLMMQGDMISQGFWPVVYQRLQREDYIKMIQAAQEGSPHELVLRTLHAQRDELLLAVSHPS